MRPVLIFSHNYLIRDWRTIVREQLSLLSRTGLYERALKIRFGVCSTDFDSSKEFHDMVKFLDTDSKTEIRFHRENNNEKDTLIWLQRLCLENPGCDVLYYHAKGVTVDPLCDREQHRLRTSWRHAMEYFCMERWPLCTRLLQTHDCVGISYAEWMWPKPGFPEERLSERFFSGNFWWATSEHVNRTDRMENRDNWLGCETMITSAPHAYCNMYHPTVFPHEHYYDPADYRGK